MNRRLLILVWLCLVSLLGWAQDTVVFSAQGGFYDDVFSLELYNYYPQNHIRYTTNGNRPTAQSPLYIEPLRLNGEKYSKSNIYTIQISPEDLIYVPDSVQHCIVIRAAVFDENDSCVSKVMTNSYFIRSLGCNTHGLAVVSLCADSLDLFGYEQGIMVPGMLFDPINPDHTGNYYQHGREWERLSHIEFYEYASNSGINQDCGLRTHGNLSRRHPSKGMKVYARSEYGKKKFKYNFFNNSTMNSYKRLVFKPFALNWHNIGIQDYICNKLALRAGLSSSDSRPVIIYLNGEYWGVYFIQEKMDETFLESHYGINEDSCNIIGDWYGNVDNGSNNNFIQMMHWFRNTSFVEDEMYQFACDNLIDIDNFIDYMVFETFVANYDWPGNNMRCWQEGNGKWKWLFFDGDASLISCNFDGFTNAAVFNPPADWLNYPEAKLVFGKLLENEHFKAAFVARVRELCNGLFLYENTYPLFYGIVEALRPHIENQKHRFGYPSSMSYWDEGNTIINIFLAYRVENYLNQCCAFMNSYESSEKIVGVYPNPSSGPIRIYLDETNTSADEISIYDMMGRKVYAQPCVVTEGRNEIALHPQLPLGLYILKVGNYVQRIVRY